MVKYNTSKTNGMDKKCRHKETGKEGIIKREMRGTKDFPDQYGIFWTLRYDNDTPSHYYWNDKDKIEIIE